MPHVIVKLIPGRTEDQKNRLAQEITRKMVEIINCSEDVISVAFEEIEQADWAEKVYRPDILAKADTLYKKPGYDPFKKGKI